MTEDKEDFQFLRSLIFLIKNFDRFKPYSPSPNCTIWKCPMLIQGLLRVPGTARRSNQPILKEINPEYLLEGLMQKLKLKLQYFGHLIWRVYSMEKTLMLGKTEGRRRIGWQRMRWLDSITASMNINLSKLGGGKGQGRPPCCSSWDCEESDVTWQLNSNNTTAKQFHTGLQLNSVSVPNTELRLFQIASDLKHLSEANKDHFKGRDHSRSVLRRKKKNKSVPALYNRHCI